MIHGIKMADAWHKGNSWDLPVPRHVSNIGSDPKGHDGLR